MDALNMNQKPEINPIWILVLGIGSAAFFALAVAMAVLGFFAPEKVAGFDGMKVFFSVSAVLLSLACICYNCMCLLEQSVTERELARIGSEVRGTQWKTAAGAVGTALKGDGHKIELAFPSGVKESYKLTEVHPV